MEPDEDSFEFPHEECFLYLDENEEPEYPVEQQQENQGPPQLTDDEISQLDHEASLEELVRLGNMGVISEYPFPNGDEMVLDTRLVFDWRFREQQWRRRARLVAREFRSGDAANEQTFSPTSRKWTIHLLLVLALVQQLSVLVMGVKDAFLTVPQKDLFLFQIPSGAKTEEIVSNGIDFWKLLRCLPGQRKAALNWREHFESIVSQFDLIPFEGMVTVYKHKVKCMYISIHVDDLLVFGSQEDCNWFKAEILNSFTVKCEGPYSVDERWECQYLKRTLVCTEAGIVVEPNKKHIPKLLELLKIENRRGKSFSRHAKLQTYSCDRILEAEKLNIAESKVFRGGLGFVCIFRRIVLTFKKV